MAAIFVLWSKGLYMFYYGLQGCVSPGVLQYIMWPRYHMSSLGYISLILYCAFVCVSVSVFVHVFVFVTVRFVCTCLWVCAISTFR